MIALSATTGCRVGSASRARTTPITSVGSASRARTAPISSVGSAPRARARGLAGGKGRGGGRVVRSSPAEDSGEISKILAEVGGEGIAKSKTATPALKEWSVTCAALAAGEQTVLLRKGGIGEKGFKAEAGQFILFPTAYHMKEDLLKPGVAGRYEDAVAYEAGSTVPIAQAAVVTGAWVTADAEVADALADLHVWNEAFLETRLKWKPSTPVTVLELRVFDLPEPINILMREEFKGCFSWVDVPVAIGGWVVDGEVAGCRPVLSDEEFAKRQAKLRGALAGIEASPIEVLEPGQ